MRLIIRNIKLSQHKEIRMKKHLIVPTALAFVLPQKIFQGLTPRILPLHLSLIYTSIFMVTCLQVIH